MSFLNSLLSSFIFLYTCSVFSFETSPYNYQQSRFLEKDVFGDFLLAELRSQYSSPKRLSKMIRGKLPELLKEDRLKFSHIRSYSELMNLPEVDFTVHIESDRQPFTKREGLLELLAPISLYPGEVHLGSCPVWSKEFMKASHAPLPPKAMGKLLTALSLGVSHQYLYIGTEGLIEDWMLGQSDHSISLRSIFRESLNLNNGNVYKSIMAIENLLSRYWRVENREEVPFIKKLSPISYILGQDGDKFGSWYHFWGLLSYGYCTGRKSLVRGVSFIESLGSHFSYGHIPEPQQDHINKVSGHIGVMLRTELLNPSKEVTYKRSLHSKILNKFGVIEMRKNKSLVTFTSKLKLNGCNISLYFTDRNGKIINKRETKNVSFHPSYQIIIPKNTFKINLTVRKCL